MKNNKKSKRSNHDKISNARSSDESSVSSNDSEKSFDSSSSNSLSGMEIDLHDIRHEW